MKKPLSSSIILLECFLILKPVKSQDVNIIQYFSAPLYYNPAYTSISTGVKARYLYRKCTVITGRDPGWRSGGNSPRNILGFNHYENLNKY